MKFNSVAGTRLAVACVYLLLTFSARAESWIVPSPDHEQTFAYGTEQHRIWAERGRDRHLVVLLDFTNDPYVDSNTRRQYDNFTFTFPGITLGRDGRTFYYHAPDGRRVAVASKRPDLFGFPEIKLLPNAALIVNRPHGYLSLVLVFSG